MAERHLGRVPPLSLNNRLWVARRNGAILAVLLQAGLAHFVSPGLAAGAEAEGEAPSARTMRQFYPREVSEPLLNGDYEAAAQALESDLDRFLDSAPTLRHRINLLMLLADIQRSALGKLDKAKPYYVRADALYDELIGKIENGWPKDNLKFWKNLRKTDIDGPASAELVREWSDKWTLISTLRARQAILDLHVLGGEYGDEKYADKGENILSKTAPADGTGKGVWKGWRWVATKPSIVRSGLEIAIEPRDFGYFNVKEGLPLPLGFVRPAVPVFVRIKNGTASAVSFKKADVLMDTPMSESGPTASLTLERISQVLAARPKLELLKRAWYLAAHPHLAPYRTGGFFEQDVAEEFASFDQQDDAKREKMAREAWHANFQTILASFDRAYSKYMTEQQERRADLQAHFDARAAAAPDEAVANRKASRGDLAGAAIARARAATASRSVKEGAKRAAEDSRRNREVWEAVSKIHRPSSGGGASDDESADAGAGELAGSRAIAKLRSESAYLEYLAQRYWQALLPAGKVWPGSLTLKPGEEWTGFLFFAPGKLDIYGKPHKGQIVFKTPEGDFEFPLKLKPSPNFAPALEERFVFKPGYRRVFLEYFHDILSFNK